MDSWKLLDVLLDDPQMENDDERTGIDTTPAACCGRGEHQPILDEQIGIVCEYCAALIMDIKYVLPPFVSRITVLLFDCSMSYNSPFSWMMQFIMCAGKCEHDFCSYAAHATPKETRGKGYR